MKKKSFFVFSRLLAAAIMILIMSGILNGQTEELKNPGQFLFPEFTKTVVAMKAGKDLLMMVNYNIVTEKMVFLQKNEIYDMFNYDQVDTVYLQGRKFVPIYKVFYEVVVEGPAILLIQHKGKIQPPPKPAAFGGTSEVSSSTYISNMQMGTDVYRLKTEADLVIRPETVYWLRIKDKYNDFISEKQFLEILPAYKQQLKKYINQNKIGFNRQPDVVKLVTYLNTLIN
jgi:hypothetical protein